MPLSPSSPPSVSVLALVSFHVFATNTLSVAIDASGSGGLAIVLRQPEKVKMRGQGDPHQFPPANSPRIFWNYYSNPPTLPGSDAPTFRNPDQLLGNIVFVLLNPISPTLPLLNAIAPLSVRMYQCPQCAWLNDQPLHCECGEWFMLFEVYVPADEANFYIERKKEIRESEAKARAEEGATQTQPQNDQWTRAHCSKQIQMCWSLEQHIESKPDCKRADNNGERGEM